MVNYFYDENRIRYEWVQNQKGNSCNWLFLPGGPGGDSRYFHSLLKHLELPGNVWFLDLPGNGDNIKNHPADYNFDHWFEIFLPAIKKFENPILVGHSFGGMFPLLFPELEELLKGFAIFNSAPCLWLEEAVLYAQKFNLPDLSKEMAEFTQNPNETTFKIALDACMPYYFPKTTLEKGRSLLSQLPFQFLPAVWWQQKAVALNISAQWIPKKVPTLIVGATYDCICPSSLFHNDERFKRSNIKIVHIEKGGHLPWIEDPETVQKELRNFCSNFDNLCV